MAEAPRPALAVGLTGGVASGKSAVSDRFAALGVPVFDADIAAREVVAPGTPGLAGVVQAFGAGVLDAEGALDRAAMRRKVFADPDARRTLENIIHPLARAQLRQQALASAGPYSLVVVPLLAETGGDYSWLDRILVVDVPRAVQRARLMARDRIDGTLADAMLDAQASRGERLAIADDVITNTGRPEELDTRVAALHAQYLAWARPA